MNDRQDMFEQDVNALLMDGWRVVPGTFAVCSFEQAANATHRFQTPAGTTFRNKFFITLERTEARSCASPSPALC